MGNVSNSNVLSEIGKQWIEKYFYFFQYLFLKPSILPPPHPGSRVLISFVAQILPLHHHHHHLLLLLSPEV